MRIYILSQALLFKSYQRAPRYLKRCKRSKASLFKSAILFTGGLSVYFCREEFNVLIKKTFQTWLNWEAGGREIGLSDDSLARLSF